MKDPKHAALVDTSRLIIKSGSKSFATAAKLFNEETRDNAYMLYAWCRHCDDVIDNQELGFNSQPQDAEVTRRVLDQLKEKTQAAIDNKPSDDPIFEGLRYVLKANEIPGRYPLELLEGFAMDAAEHQYKSFDETLQYCYYVAGVVGLMMAYVMGARDEAALQRATDLGIAFQLTNISRDVREDALIGRVYLPEDWLAAAGIPPQELSNPEYSAALIKVVERLLNEADRYYASADQGLRALGFRSAWAVASARGVYKAIGDKVRQRGVSALDERVVVRKRRKLLGIAEGMIDALKASWFDNKTQPAPRDSDLWTAPPAVH
ncbi:MAG: phytoene/squalene synthase family protein [Chromatiales bacterium]|nr:phytoene/squalene synthase family protein [Chromatiales bacterium]